MDVSPRGSIEWRLKVVEIIRRGYNNQKSFAPKQK